MQGMKERMIVKLFANPQGCRVEDYDRVGNGPGQHQPCQLAFHRDNLQVYEMSTDQNIVADTSVAKWRQAFCEAKAGKRAMRVCMDSNRMVYFGYAMETEQA